MKKLLAVFVLGFIGATASAQEPATAAGLLERCRASVRAMDRTSHLADADAALKEGIDTGYCLGYATATRSLMYVVDPFKTTFCPDAGVTLQQMIRVLVKYLEAHPELLQKDAFGVTIGAWNTSFPCKQAKP